MPKIIESNLKKYNEIVKFLGEKGVNLDQEKSLDDNLLHLQERISNDSEKELLDDAVNRIKTIKNDLLDFIKVNPFMLSLLPKELICQDIFLAAVQKDVRALQFVNLRFLKIAMGGVINQKLYSPNYRSIHYLFKEDNRIAFLGCRE